jgi:excisionase family DNA binding protein
MGWKQPNRMRPMQHTTAENSEPGRRTLTVPEAAKVLGIGRTAAYEAAHTGEIPTIRVGKRILVPVAALNRLLEEASPREAA